VLRQAALNIVSTR